jgi:hypothetical protein
MKHFFLKNIFLLFPVFFLGQCITIQLPPITVTGTKTAAEKQIIGEQRELEKDVWMISSAKTTTSVAMAVSEDATAVEKKPEEATIAFKGFAIIDAFAEEFSELKKDGVAGENRDGLVSNLLNETSIVLPEEIRDKYNAENENSSYQVLVETVKQMNLARKYIIEGYVAEQKSVNPDFNPDKAELLKIQKDQYHGSLQKGEFFQNGDGTWVPKK